MTAEIAILNTGAVALAADSAVTAYPGGNQKIFSSANKLFALTEHAPVGILIYGNAGFMGMPLETLIKEYRRKHGQEVFPRLEGYMIAFRRFLTEEIGGIITEKDQETFILRIAAHVLHEIDDEIEGYVLSIEEKLRQTQDTEERRVLQEEINSIPERIIGLYYLRASEAGTVEGMTDEVLMQGRKILAEQLPILRQICERWNLTEETTEQLDFVSTATIGAMGYDLSFRMSGTHSGIVLAGFGDIDLFPAIHEIRVEGMLDGFLKSAGISSKEVNPQNAALIVPFAQTDMIDTFMMGIAPQYRSYLRQSVETLLSEYANTLRTEFGNGADIPNDDLGNQLSAEHATMAESFVNGVGRFGNNRVAKQIFDVVATLPKEQLAEMAESLVSLTSLKRRVSLDEETVGGPTDVAVITKGDGLVWIKRKHYFPAELNPAYFARRFGTGSSYDTARTGTPDGS